MQLRHRERESMEGVLLHLRLISFALFGVLTTSLAQHDPRLLNSSSLEMFVDQLPQLPKLLGFQVVSAIPKSKSLQIGMFKKKWVTCFFFSFSFLFNSSLFYSFQLISEQFLFSSSVVSTIFRTLD